MAWGFQHMPLHVTMLQCHTLGGKKITGKKSVPRGDPQRFSQKFLHPDLAFSSARVGKPQPKIAAVRLHRNSKKKKTAKMLEATSSRVCVSSVCLCVCVCEYFLVFRKRKRWGKMPEVSEVGTLSPLGIPNFQRSQ